MFDRGFNVIFERLQSQWISAQHLEHGSKSIERNVDYFLIDVDTFCNKKNHNTNYLDSHSTHLIIIDNLELLSSTIKKSLVILQ